MFQVIILAAIHNRTKMASLFDRGDQEFQKRFNSFLSSWTYSDFEERMRDVNRDGKKHGHYAWYVYPTELEGRNQPTHKFGKVTMDGEMLYSLFGNNSANIALPLERWMLFLEHIIALCEWWNARGQRIALKHIFPQQDHGRIEHFFTNIHKMENNLIPCIYSADMVSKLDRLVSIVQSLEFHFVN